MLSATLHRYQLNKQAQERGEETEEGFTLIELLIVIVVLGILAAVTVFALSGTTAKSASAACDADAQSVNTALIAFQTQNPSTAATSPAIVGSSTTQASNLVPTYLQSWPNSTHYTISLSAYSGTATPSQTVMVSAPASATAVQFPAPTNGTDPCSTAK
jgi:prepilin-type N-terminal cleavage/methylation domain-containing protein